MVKTNYTRGELIKICEDAIVKESKWSDRDSHSAHCKLGSAWALLKAGCPFIVMCDEKKNLCTNDNTIWIEISAKGFKSFEYAEDEERYDTETYYLPTRKRLKNRSPNDWY